MNRRNIITSFFAFLGSLFFIRPAKADEGIEIVEGTVTKARISTTEHIPIYISLSFTIPGEEWQWGREINSANYIGDIGSETINVKSVKVGDKFKLLRIAKTYYIYHNWLNLSPVAEPLYPRNRLICGEYV